jgi:hypothetical protein
MISCAYEFFEFLYMRENWPAFQKEIYHSEILEQNMTSERNRARNGH